MASGISCVKGQEVTCDKLKGGISLMKSEYSDNACDSMDSSLLGTDVSTLNESNLSIKDESSRDDDSNLGASSVSGDYCDTDNQFLTAEMIKEEERLKRQTEKEKEKLHLKHMKEQHVKELKEQRYKSLMSLLEKSQFFSKFALNKLKSTDGDTDRNKKNKKRKANQLENYSEEIQAAATKKLKTCEGTLVSRKALGEMAVNLQLNNTSYSSEVNKSDDVDRKKTKITSLGIEVPVSQPTLLTGAALRDYQLEGLDWLKRLFVAGINGILADEMGLGKTIQIISLICHLYEEKVAGPFLIVAPLSTLPNWMVEFEKFAPDIPTLLYHGAQKTRASLRKHFNKGEKLFGLPAYPVIITSYEIPIKDEPYLSKMPWKYIIVDEGHKLKNFQSILSRCLSRLQSVNRLLLTGTPLQNDLTELWSLLHFLLPEVFMKLDDFCSWFQVEDLQNVDSTEVLIQKEKENHVLSVLHQILSPFLLRRVKSDVNLNIPPKKEMLVYCPISDTQYKLYSATVDKSIEHMKYNELKEKSVIIPDNEDGTKRKRSCVLSKRRSSVIPSPEKSIENGKDDDCLEVQCDDETYSLNIKLSNPMMMLRKICNHPYLVQCPVYPGSNWMKVDERIVSTSGKMIVLDTLLAKLKARNHKILLFSTFTSILDIMEEYLSFREYKYLRLDGKTDLEERKENIKLFNTDKEIFIFLLSTRAGGLGINLTGADTVIIFDSDWNPQVDLQAQDRCHRIGQEKFVMVYRLVSCGTIDESIVNRAAAKRMIEKMIIHAGKFKYQKNTSVDKQLDFQYLKELLEKKNHFAEIRSDGTVLTEEQWEVLLDRSLPPSDS